MSEPANPNPNLGRIGKYELVEKVGQGGMATVYRAHDGVLDRDVALKLLHPHLAERQELRQRFAREARAVARLQHPRVVKIYDFSTDDQQQCFIVTEFIAGRTLKQFVEQQPIVLPELAALIVHALCGALSHAHSLGIVHRDIKPENVMVSAAGELKLMDFGVAQMLDTQAQMTMTGALLGSPAYMSPEQVEGGHIDHRADIFAMGTLLYWLTTGRLPFDAPTTPALLKKILDAEYTPPGQISEHVDSGLAKIIARALVREPDGRYSTADQLQRALAQWLAVAGLERPEESLREYLRTPGDYQRQLRERLAVHYCERADKALGAGHATAALECFNRVLALEPQNRRVLDRLKSLTRQEQTKKLVRAVAGAAAIIVLFASVLLSLVWLAQETSSFMFRENAGRQAAPLGAPAPAAVAPPDQRQTPDAPPPAVPVPLSEPPAAAAGPPAAPRPRAAEHAAPVAAEARSLAPAPASAAEPLAVTIRLNTWAKLFIDGRPFGAASRRMFQDVSLAPGRHRLRFINPYYETLEEEVEVAANNRNEFVFKLQPAPATISIYNPQNADVKIDGRYEGSAADSVNRPLSIKMAENQTSRQVRLRLLKEGYRAWEQEITVRAGERKVLNVELSPAGSAGGPESANQ